MATLAITVRAEEPGDQDAVHAVNAAAFERHDEANLVDRLRTVAEAILSLVADDDGVIVGHALFTPVHVTKERDGWSAMALGPMAVLPQHQRTGIGGKLISAGLERCREMNAPAVFVLGHPEYYPRFGFEPASRYGCRCTWNVPDNVFMMRVLDAQQVCGGIVAYNRLFDDVA